MIAAAGLGAGIALAAGGPSTHPDATAASYSYYRSVVDASEPGGMMGISGSTSIFPSWLTGRAGYAWMMGGVTAPAWMRGRLLPASMMGSGADPGNVMGALFANAPGMRVEPATAKRLGEEVPPHAHVDRAERRLTFSTTAVRLVALASPSMPGENFEIAGMSDPTLVVPVGATVTVELVNADADMAHGFVVTARGASSTWTPMMSAPPAFSGSALWFLGASSTAGMHAGTLSFTASVPGTYAYLCPVPGHAAEGMAGRFVVAAVH